MPNKEKQLAIFWLAAAHSGRVSKNDWQYWANKQIGSAEHPDDWVFAMSIAESTEELWKALGPQMINAQAEEAMDDAVLGHIWQRYVNGEISLGECLLSAAEKADCSSASIGCEEIYALLQELNDSSDETTVSQKAAKLFSHVHETAQKQWMTLFGDSGNRVA